eukprot:scaffold17793_cov131-Isochrysis_galbana.AAC.10
MQRRLRYSRPELPRSDPRCRSVRRILAAWSRGHAQRRHMNAFLAAPCAVHGWSHAHRHAHGRRGGAVRAQG